MPYGVGVPCSVPSVSDPGLCQSGIVEAMEYEAFWVPESSASKDLAIGEQWLRDANYPGQRIIVLNTVKIADDVPALAEIMDRYTAVSPRTQNRPSGSGHAVLAPWVFDEALELAEELASPGGGLLVIDSDPRRDEVEEWIARTHAACLT